MDFSDKFEKIDISPIVDASECQDYDPEQNELNNNTGLQEGQ